MQFDWRAISGPALTTVTALIAFFVDRHFVAVPNPAPLFVCIVAFASSVSGTTSGLISAVIAVASSALFFLNHRALPGYDPSDLARMLLLAATATGTCALIKGVYAQAQLAGSSRVYWQTHETNQTAMQLYDKVAERSGFVVYRKLF